MPRFIEGQDRHQVTLLPESLDEFIAEDNAVRVVDAFVNELDLADLGFEGIQAAETGRPSYHPTVLLKIYIYGYLNRVQSSRRLERECQRNLEVMWLTGRQAPRQPHHLQIALALSLESAARLDAVEVAVDIDLEQNRRVVRRPARLGG